MDIFGHYISSPHFRSNAFHRRGPLAESCEALANHFPFLPSTQVSDLKAVVAIKDTVLTHTVQKPEKGAKGDRGEPGQRGQSGLDVSMTEGILEAYGKK